MDNKTFVALIAAIIGASIAFWYFVLRTTGGTTTTTTSSTIPITTCTNICPPGQEPDILNNCQCVPIIPNTIQLYNTNIAPQQSFYFLWTLLYSCACFSVTGWVTAAYPSIPSSDQMKADALLFYCKKIYKNSVQLQPISITGVVKSSTGQPIPNVSVNIGDFSYTTQSVLVYDNQGAANYNLTLKWSVDKTSTVTDNNGNFTFNLIPTITISYGGGGNLPNNLAPCPLTSLFSTTTDTGVYVNATNSFKPLSYTVSTGSISAQGIVNYGVIGYAVSVGIYNCIPYNYIICQGL